MSTETLEIKVSETIKVSDIVGKIIAIVYDISKKISIDAPLLNIYDGPHRAFSAVRRYAARPPTLTNQPSLFSSPL